MIKRIGSRQINYSEFYFGNSNTRQMCTCLVRWDLKKLILSLEVINNGQLQ